MNPSAGQNRFAAALFLFAGAISLTSLTACDNSGSAPSGSAGSPSPSPGPSGGGDPNLIKIVSSLPRTGSANAQTGTIVNGIHMAIDEIGGKIGQYTIVYEDWDDASPQRGNWDPAVENANA